MSNQIYWEDIDVDTEIPPLSKIAHSVMLVKWAGASGDFNPLHFDSDFTQATGVGKPIVHGALKRQWLIQLLTDWMGIEGMLKSFSCRFRAMDIPRAMKTWTEPVDGETWHCKGTVTKKYEEGKDHLIDCKVWLENGKGETTTTGSATIILPNRSWVRSFHKDDM